MHLRVLLWIQVTCTDLVCQLKIHLFDRYKPFPFGLTNTLDYINLMKFVINKAIQIFPPIVIRYYSNFTNSTVTLWLTIP